MSNRLDLYGPVHKGIRHCMQSTLIRLGRIDIADDHDIAECVAQVREMIAMLEAHLAIENTFVNPAVLARKPDGLGHLADDHEHHERAFAILLRDAEHLTRAATQELAHRFYLAVSRFVAENLLHMTVEETELNPLLWQLFTDAELQALLDQILATEGPETLARTTRWLMPALAPAERAQTLIGARRAIPAPIFEHVLSVVQGLISPVEWTKLATALAA